MPLQSAFAFGDVCIRTGPGIIDYLHQNIELLPRVAAQKNFGATRRLTIVQFTDPRRRVYVAINGVVGRPGIRDAASQPDSKLRAVSHNTGPQHFHGWRHSVNVACCQRASPSFRERRFTGSTGLGWPERDLIRGCCLASEDIN